MEGTLYKCHSLRLLFSFAFFSFPFRFPSTPNNHITSHPSILNSLSISVQCSGMALIFNVVVEIAWGIIILLLSLNNLFYSVLICRVKREGNSIVRERTLTFPFLLKFLTSFTDFLIFYAFNKPYFSISPILLQLLLEFARIRHHPLITLHFPNYFHHNAFPLPFNLTFHGPVCYGCPSIETLSIRPYLSLCLTNERPYRIKRDSARDRE